MSESDRPPGDRPPYPWDDLKKRAQMRYTIQRLLTEQCHARGPCAKLAFRWTDPISYLLIIDGDVEPKYSGHLEFHAAKWGTVTIDKGPHFRGDHSFRLKIDLTK